MTDRERALQVAREWRFTALSLEELIEEALREVREEERVRFLLRAARMEEVYS